MIRRDFIKVNGTILGTGALVSAGGWMMAGHHDALSEQDPLIGRLVGLNDEKIPGLLAVQEPDPDHRWYGGVKNAHGIHNPHSTEGFIRTIGCSVSYPESPFYRDDALLEPMSRAIEYMLRIQHEDGTIDLYSTNFHSTPDTAFIVKRMAPIYLILQRMGWEEIQPFLTLLDTFLMRAGKALISGGIHTPNHRWVVSAALAWLNHIAPDPAYVRRIDEWLAEGIDLDPDGQFNEKSTSVYTPLTDRVFITMARLLNRPALLDPVRKNLEMMQYYVHPNGEVVTEASGRQDKYNIATMEGFYYPYRYMAIKEKNGVFAGMCQMIERTTMEKIAPYLNYLLEDVSLQDTLPDPAPPATEYEKAFPYSGVYRIRRGDMDATIIANNPTFFTMHKGNAVLQSMRLSTAFFGRGQFQAQEVEMKDGRYVLSWFLTRPYFQPLPVESLPGDGDWNKMPRSARTLSEVQELYMVVTIGEQDGTFTLDFDLHGTENVPVNLELGFRKGGLLEGVQALEDVEDAWLLSSGYGRFEAGGSSIQFGPGHTEHTWTEMRGALPKPDLDCVYMTGYTPFKKTITIK